ncbi:MAG: VWA domain-containing protein [Saprospiraceae bacterium]|nr:VWA domain-containing protein [Pyrinomonadaceae bacterium]
MVLALRITLFAFLFFAQTAFLFSQDDDEVISVNSSLVVLNATISDGAGKHVSGLAQKHFKIFEDGTEQEISVFTTEETPFAAVLLIDTSGSMEERVSMARAAAIRFLDGLRANDTAAIYRFDSKVHLVQPFSNSRDVSEQIFDLKADGMTTLNDAIFQAAEELGKRPEKRRAIIVLSDGQDTMSRRSADKALKAALAANALIYTVDMSAINTTASQTSTNQGVLKNFAEKTGGVFVSTPGGAAMRAAFANIVGELGVQYTLGYQPANIRKDGKWRAIELRVARPNLTIRSRKGYHAEKIK